MPLVPGRMLSHYRLVEKIGEGGMGVVWRAEDTRLGREVAIKVLHAAAAGDSERLRRFQIEARAVAVLNHPNIVTLHSVEEADGIHFVTLELVSGHSLRERIANSALPLRQLLEIACPMAEAVGAAHAQGIVHRDLKPDNLMISDTGLVKVLDFGLARLLEEDAGSGADLDVSPTRTMAGAVMGTLEYMSPEQAHGRPADARSDVFSLGVVLFEMATGRRPFRGDSPLAVISSIVKDPTPSTASMPEVIPALATILERCLQKDPGARYPDAGELGVALGALKEQISGVNPVTDTKPPSALRWIVPVLGTVALALLAGWYFIGDRAPVGAEAAQVLPARTASVAILPLSVSGDNDDDRAFADGIHDDMILQASKIRALKVISRTSVMAYRDSRRKLGDIAAELGVTTVVEGSMRRAGNRVRINVKLVDAQTEKALWGDSFDRALTAREVFDIQSEIVEQIAVALEATLTSSERASLNDAPTGDLEAYRDYLRGLAISRKSPSRTNIEDKIAAFQSAVERDPTMARAWARLSSAHMQLYWRAFDTSAQRRKASLDALLKAEALQAAVPETAMARGYYHYWGFRDYPAAIASFELAEQGMPNDASLIAAKSFVQRRSGQWEMSVASLERALSLDPRNAYFVENLINSYRALRRWDDAIDLCDVLRRLKGGRSILHLSTRLDASGNPFPMLRELELGELDVSEIPDLAALIRFARAYESGERWLTATKEIQSQQVGWSSRAMIQGEWLSLAGRRDEAVAPLRMAQRQLEFALRQDPEDWRLLASLGLVRAYQGDVSAARAAGEQAVGRMPYSLDAMHGMFPMRTLAAIYALTGATDDALATLERLLDLPGQVSAAYLAQDPRFDSLRGDPRFRELMMKHGWSGTLWERR